jgi:hypothetical protein
MKQVLLDLRGARIKNDKGTRQSRGKLFVGMGTKVVAKAERGCGGAKLQSKQIPLRCLWKHRASSPAREEVTSAQRKCNAG